MNNKKVLFCSEASWLSTGYSVYTKEVLSRLHQVDGIEVAELACYIDANDANIKNVPWGVYPNKPLPNDPAYGSYSSSPSAQFGEQSFNHILLSFQPDMVIDIRDWWMIEFEQRSPFREFFHWAIMPTVDAEPQANQWINTYSAADSVFAYSEFGRDTMLSQSDAINFIDIASPAASDNFFPVEDKQQHKSNIGVSPESIVVGTVMRNQKRKLYPDLFQSFRSLLDEIDDNRVVLYCHTYYPDVGWDLPYLINKHGLGNRVLFTYKCKNCGNISPDFFQDSAKYCHSCGSFSSMLAGINNSVNEQELAYVYNIFDIYVQYANSEGFGMPQLEAAYCGLPVMSTYYSAMQSVIDNVGGIGIKPLSYYTECETGCKRAVPNNSVFVEKLKSLIQKFDQPDFAKIGSTVRKNALDNYNWDKTADVWRKHILATDKKDPSETWLSPPHIPQPEKEIPPQIVGIPEKVNFIFDHILHKPQWKGEYLWKRLLRDLTFGFSCENVDKDFYFNESHVQSMNGLRRYTIEQACEEMGNFRNQLNQWEEARLQIIQ